MRGVVMASSRGRTKTRVCCVDGCGKPRYCRDRCLVHYGAFRRMTNAERTAELEKSKQAPVLTPWTYEGDENALAEMTAKSEAQKQ